MKVLIPQTKDMKDVLSVIVLRDSTLQNPVVQATRNAFGCADRRISLADQAPLDVRFYVSS